MSVGNSDSTPRGYEHILASMRERIDQGNSFEAIQIGRKWLDVHWARKPVVDELIRAYEECGFKEDADRIRKRRQKIWPRQRGANQDNAHQEISSEAIAKQREILNLLYQPASEDRTRAIIALGESFLEKNGQSVEILAAMRDACMNVKHFDAALNYAHKISAIAPNDKINNRKVIITGMLKGDLRSGIDRLYRVVSEQYDPGTMFTLKDLAKAGIETNRYRELLKSSDFMTPERLGKCQIDDSVAELPADAPNYDATIERVLLESTQRHRRIDSQAPAGTHRH